jgi:hypothetical protein
VFHFLYCCIEEKLDKEIRIKIIIGILEHYTTPSPKGCFMEKDLEAKVGRWVKRRGGLWLKWTSPGFTGVPDRILIAQGGKVVFVEMKQESGRLMKRQVLVGALLKRMGCAVYQVFNEDEARQMLREVMPDEV